MGCMDAESSEQEAVSREKLQSQEDLLNQAIADFQQQGRVGSGVTPYGGQRVAGMDPATSGAIEGAQGLTGQFTDQNIPLYGEATGAIGNILSGQTGIPQISMQQAGDVFSETREAPRFRSFEQYEAPGYREEFAGPNYQSSARAEAVTRARENVGEELGEQRAGYLWDVEGVNRQIGQQNIQNQLSAAGQAGVFGQLPTQVAGQRLAGLGGIAQMGGIAQQQKQAELNAQMAKFQESLSFMDPQDLEIMMRLLGQSFQTSQSSGSSSGAGLGYVGASSAMDAAGGNFGARFFPAPQPAG